LALNSLYIIFVFANNICQTMEDLLNEVVPQEDLEVKYIILVLIVIK